MPLCNPRWSRRERLLALLDRALGNRLTLGIRACGFRKNHAVRQWWLKGANSSIFRRLPGFSLDGGD